MMNKKLIKKYWDYNFIYLFFFFLLKNIWHMTLVAYTAVYISQFCLGFFFVREREIVLNA